MKHKLANLGVVTLALLGLALCSLAQPPAAPPTLSDTVRSEAVASAAAILRNRYVFPDVGEQAAQAIEAALAEGEYDGITQYQPFAVRVTADLQAITNDKHLRVMAPGAPVHINTFINRTPDTESFTTREFWSETTPFSFTDKPIYVLTSDFTFSGGEEFAYDMQVLGLAKLVGTITGGGANPGGVMPIAAGLTIFVRSGRAENPITGTNWEGVGVVPDIDVPSADALAVALERLGVSPAVADIDTASQSRVFEPSKSRRTAPTSMTFVMPMPRCAG